MSNSSLRIIVVIIIITILVIIVINNSSKKNSKCKRSPLVVNQRSLDLKHPSSSWKAAFCSFPAFQAHFTSVSWIARVMPVDGVVVRHAVLTTLWPIPPLITHFVSIVGAFVLYLFSDGVIFGQTRRWTVDRKTMEAIKADFLAFVVASVIPAFVIAFRNTENGAVYSMPSMHARLTSVMRTKIMPLIIVARNALLKTLGAKPWRKALLHSISRSTSVGKKITLI